ncbi:MAG: 50S ribosomal protein L10 [Candidatus Shapirobacteria bacterium]|nr:50S ribosomal protein L10 [Candidatus Shapirobacteria bacterium]MDD5073883.1 50S ribosomal protein L10 [Candidatus Shapirobacteria bacterium]MDD5481476.1 50S ribosomal protein L10 [Candidatus Shapirobacteria bacterium]
MVKQTKLYEVDDLKIKLSNSKSFFLIGYQGWDANLFNLLRQKISQEGGQLRVIRNNLFERATEGLVGDKPSITGPVACLFSLDDEVAPLSILCEFLKENSLEPDLRSGFLTETGQSLDSQETVRLANLPSVQSLRSMLVGGLAASLSRLLFCLNSPTQKLALVIKALQDRQGGEE